jgi:hypothetical protein
MTVDAYESGAADISVALQTRLDSLRCGDRRGD